MVGCLLLPYRAGGEAQERALAVCATYLSVIEPVSLQEICFALPEAAGAASMLAEIAQAANRQLGVPCRAGAGISKLVALIAAREQPGAVVRAGEEAKFLAPLPVGMLRHWGRRVLRPRQIWEAGAPSELVLQHLHELGLHTFGLLQRVPVSFLISSFGLLGKALHHLAFGRDHSPVRPRYPPPMMEARLPLAGGVQDDVALALALRQIAAQVATQLRGRAQQCRQVTLIIEGEEGEPIARSLRTGIPIADETGVLLAAQRLLERARVKAPVAAFTLQLAGLERAAGAQPDLWGGRRQREQAARERLSKALSAVRERFGAEAARWAAELEVPRREQALAFFAGQP